MLGVNQTGEGQEENNDMMPVQTKMDETKINGVAGPAPVSQGPSALPTRTVVEADLGRICSEELVKVTSTISTGEPTGYGGRPTEAPPRKPTANTVQTGAPCPYESSCSAAKECRSNAGRCGLMPTKLAESYYGYVETVEDAVMIVEACRFGRLMRVKRRLLEKERQGIRSGSVFVFVERESGIRRWTDGKVWSPSRICGEFLIYRELESRQSNPNIGASTTGRKPSPSTAATASHVNWTEQVAKILAAKNRLAVEENGEDEQANKEDSLEPEKKRPAMQVSAAAVDSAVASIRLALAAASHSHTNDPSANGSSPAPQSTAGTSTSSTSSGSGGGTSSGNGGGKSMIFKRDGLIKKTISLTVSDETYHLICYFKDSNLGSELLHLTPSRMAAFKNLDLCRNPVSYPIMMLQPGHGMNSGTTNPIPPQQLHLQQLQQQQQQQMGYPGAGRIMSNGQYIAIPQAYMAQLMPAHHSIQQVRRLAPHQQTIATGSVQLPPVLFKSNGTGGNRSAGIANLLADPSCSAVDMENIGAMVGNGNAMSGCATGVCPGACPSSGSCSRTAAAAPNPAPVLPAADNLEEEQLLFCHFLEAIKHEDGPK